MINNQEKPYSPEIIMVLYASTIDISVSNGPGVNEREFTQALSRRFGEQVAFVLPVPSCSTLAGHPDGHVLFRPFRSRLLYLFSQLAYLLTLWRVSRRLRPRLLIVRCGQLPLGLALFARLSKAPIALKTQGDPTMKYLCDQPGIKGFISRCLRPINLWAVQTLVDRAVSVDCCTPQLVNRNREYLGASTDKIFLVENATNIDRFQPQSVEVARARVGLQDFSPVIGYVGGVPWERGGAQIIHAVAALRDRYPNIAGMVVGGHGAGLQSLRQLAQDIGVENRCFIPGQVPYEEVSNWINSFDIGVAMDLADRANYVGSSNQKIRQYLACGKPIIASAGVNEFLVEHRLGSTVEENDIDGFVAAANLYLARSEADVAEHALRARRYAADHFSIDATLAARVDRWKQLGIQIP